MDYVSKLIKSNKTVFTYQDLSILLWIKSRNSIKSLLARYVDSWLLRNVHAGIYVLPKYNEFELATKIKKNSYISFESVLKPAWVIFQDYWNKIFLASDKTGQKDSDWLVFEYRKLRDDILYNQLWIEHKWQYAIATPERALCDRLYISKNYYFDNIEHLNFIKLREIAQIYNKRVILSVNKMIDDFEHTNA